jgi:hypothetical protein
MTETSVIASDSQAVRSPRDCFVAEPVLGPAFGPTRGLLAMMF